MASERTEVSAPPSEVRASHRVTGRLVDSEGAPRAGLEVAVQTWGLGGAADVIADVPGAAAAGQKVTTDDAGRFVFTLDGARSGSLSLEAEHLVFAERARFRGDRADQDLGDLLVVDAATITGVVRDQLGAPVPGVRVSAEFGPMGFGSTSRTETDEQGAFVVGRLRPGTWTLRATSARHLPGAAEQRLEAGQQLEGVVITLEAGAAIAGRVVDERGVGVGGMSVTSQRTERTGEVEIVRFSDEEAAVTGADGSFVVAGLEGQRATLKAYGDGHTTAIQVVEVGAEPVVMRVQRLARISGVLVNETGDPVAGSRVRASTDGGAEGGATALVEDVADLDLHRIDGARATTDEAGRFVIEGVRPGAVRIKAEGEAHLPVERRGLRIEPAQHLEGVRLLARAGASATVEVVDESGEPVAGARVDVKLAPKRQPDGMRFEARVEGEGPSDFVLGDRRKLGSAETDASGEAAVYGLPAVEAVFEASHPGYAAADPQRAQLPSAGSVTQRLVLREPCYVDVRVLDAVGAVAAGASVMLRSASPDAAREGDRRETDQQGRVRFGPLRAGDYTAVLTRPPEARRLGGMMMFVGDDEAEIRSSQKSVTVAAGATVEVTLEAPVLARWRGRVLGSEGAAAGVVVELESMADPDAVLGFGGRQQTTNAAGEFAFEGVERGRYEVRYGKPGQVVKAKYELEVPAGVTDLQRDLTLRTGSLRVAVVTEQDAEPVAKAEITLVRQDAAGVAGAKDGKRRPQRVMMVSVVSGSSSGESTSTMTFGNQRVSTDEDGVATFDDVPVGDYTLRVESSRFAPLEKEGVVVVERQLTDCGTLTVAPAGQLRGVVEDQDGKRAMALVECRAVGGEQWEHHEVAMQGSYRVRGLAPGSYEVRARAIGPQTGEPSQPVQVEVVAGRTEVVDLKVTR